MTPHLFEEMKTLDPYKKYFYDSLESHLLESHPASISNGAVNYLTLARFSRIAKLCYNTSPVHPARKVIVGTEPLTGFNFALIKIPESGVDITSPPQPSSYYLIINDEGYFYTHNLDSGGQSVDPLVTKMDLQKTISLLMRMMGQVKLGM